MMLLFTEEPTHTMLPHNTVQQKDGKLSDIKKDRINLSEMFLKEATLYFIHADNQLQHLTFPPCVVNIRI